VCQRLVPCRMEYRFGGPHQYRVQVRRKRPGLSEQDVREVEARPGKWQRIMEGKGHRRGSWVDRKGGAPPAQPSFQACDWMLDGKAGWETTPNAKKRLRQAPLLEGEQVRGLVVGFDP